MWRISSLVSIEHRLKIDGGRPLFAGLDFRMMPSSDSDVTLIFAWIEPENERWIDAIHNGLNKFLDDRRKVGQPVGYTRIEMKRVLSHPLDTDAYAVEYNMTRALETAFRDHATDSESVR